MNSFNVSGFLFEVKGILRDFSKNDIIKLQEMAVSSNDKPQIFSPFLKGWGSNQLHC